MKSFQQCMTEYHRQIKKGDIKIAYRGLMDYFNNLHLYFMKSHPSDSVSSSVYQGYMDMTYFGFLPRFLKNKKLRIAIVFLHEQFRFEVWLSGFNKKTQTKYWNLVKNSNWKKYHVPSTTKGVDSIIEHILVEDPNFDNLEKLTKQIHDQTLIFVKDIEDFLSKYQDF